MSDTTDTISKRIAEAALVPSAGASSRGWHRLESWHHCHQHFAYRHILRLQPLTVKPALALGSMFHIAEMYRQLALTGRSRVDPIQAMRDAPRRIAHTLNEAISVFSGYRTRFGAEVLRILDIEREFIIRVGGHLHTQRLDLVIQGDNSVLDAGNTRIWLSSEKAYVWDHKTTGTDPKAAAREWISSGQFNSARLVAENTFADIYGLPFGGTIINVVGTDPDDTGKFRYARHELAYEEKHYLPVVDTIFETNEEISACRKAGRDPWQYTRSYQCMSRYGMCEYYRLCTAGKDVAETEFIVAEDIVSEVTQ